MPEQFSGPYARDAHRDGLGDDYARDGGWSGGGRHDDWVREPDRGACDDEVETGKASE